MRRPDPPRVRSTVEPYVPGVEAARQLRFKAAGILRAESVEDCSRPVARTRGADVRLWTGERDALAWLAAKVARSARRGRAGRTPHRLAGGARRS